LSVQTWVQLQAPHLSFLIIPGWLIWQNWQLINPIQKVELIGILKISQLLEIGSKIPTFGGIFGITHYSWPLTYSMVFNFLPKVKNSTRN